MSGPGNNKRSGYPVGNFGIAGEIGTDGGILSHILYNPSELGPWLEELGMGEFSVSVEGVEIRDTQFSGRQITRLFPEALVEFSDERIDGIITRLEIRCPIAVNDAFTTSLPAIMVDINIENAQESERTVELSFRLRPALHLADTHLLQAGSFWLVGTDSTCIGFDRAISWQGTSGRTQVSCRVDVPGGSSKSVRFVLLHYESGGFYSNSLVSIRQLANYVSENWTDLQNKLQDFVETLPRVGDESIDRYLRWYTSAGILFTRLTRKEVLTMGYAELNQRDSFWTSWIHLVLWPELEQKMLLESAEHQREDGKIPTTILPVIEREDDIDINEYFVLRAVRCYQWTRDPEFIKSIWPNIRRAVEYLKACDKDGDYLLDQGSFWGDWKDVKGVEGRKASPHFELLWLAVLKGAAELAEELGDADARQEYEMLFEKASDTIHRKVEDGGMWTGTFYTSRWYDGREDLHVQQDQVVGPLYGVVPGERVRSVFDSLAPNLTPWGYRDTYPYRENFSHRPGDYHNGGVWVFLNFVDALARFKCGYPDEGEEILKRVGYWDLEKWGDYMPHEYLDGDTGEGGGKPLQAWDAACYAAVVFGLLGVKVTGKNSVEIMPRIPSDRSFSTTIVLPLGRIRIDQKPSAKGPEITVSSECSGALELTYGVLLDTQAPGGDRIKVGDCVFRIVKSVIEQDCGQVCLVMA